MPKRVKGVFTPVPEDFEVTPRMIELAKENGWPDPRTQVEAFKDHHLAYGTFMADWQAGFRTWLRNSVRFARERGRPIPAAKPPVRSVGMRVVDGKPHDPEVTKMISSLAEKFDVRKKA